MEHVPFDLLTKLALDPDNGWSIGSFGAVGEFVRNAEEPAAVRLGPEFLEIATPRGAMRIAPVSALAGVAWDSLSADGESWGHALAFCCPRPETPSRVIRSLGADASAIRDEDRGGQLFDLGVASGAVAMCLRTSDDALIAALVAEEGKGLLSAPSLMGEFLRAQPNRVLLSPAGRIEVFQPIPPPDGTSPDGPHTHLLPKLTSKDRPHGSNTPIPVGWQSALTLHPRSPWRTKLGERHAFRAEIDEAFAPLLSRFGLVEDTELDAQLRAAIDGGATPEFAEWPDTRRGRTKARIVLRRLAAAGDTRVKSWRALHDRAPVEIEEGDDA